MSASVLPFPKDGVKLSEFDNFIDNCGGVEVLQTLTTTDVNNTFQMPMTKGNTVLLLFTSVCICYSLLNR
jgi:hypothetical protein